MDSDYDSNTNSDEILLDINSKKYLILSTSEDSEFNSEDDFQISNNLSINSSNERFNNRGIYVTSLFSDTGEESSTKNEKEIPCDEHREMTEDSIHYTKMNLINPEDTSESYNKEGSNKTLIRIIRKKNLEKQTQKRKANKEKSKKEKVKDHNERRRAKRKEETEEEKMQRKAKRNEYERKVGEKRLLLGLPKYPKLTPEKKKIRMKKHQEATRRRIDSMAEDELYKFRQKRCELVKKFRDKKRLEIKEKVVTGEIPPELVTPSFNLKIPNKEKYTKPSTPDQIERRRERMRKSYADKKAKLTAQEFEEYKARVNKNKRRSIEKKRMLIKDKVEKGELSLDMVTPSFDLKKPETEEQRKDRLGRKNERYRNKQINSIFGHEIKTEDITDLEIKTEDLDHIFS